MIDENAAITIPRRCFGGRNEEEELRELILAGTQFDDANVRNLAAFRGLRFLNLLGTGVGDAGLETLGELTSLETLVLTGTNVTSRGLGALSASGTQLYAVNTPEGRLAIFNVAVDGSLSFVDDVPVGVDPVSCALRPGPNEDRNLLTILGEVSFEGVEVFAFTIVQPVANERWIDEVWVKLDDLSAQCQLRAQRARLIGVV